MLFGNSHIACKKVFGESLQTQTPSLEISAKSAILVDFDTGRILYEKNSHEKLSPASITKIMTMILICEAIEKGRIKLSDRVVASQNASSLGGSQVYLKENEEMTVEELLKSIAIASANDACVALAEHIAGSVQEFVYMMNKKKQKNLECLTQTL